MSDATRHVLRGEFAADVPGCRMPGTYMVTDGRLWVRSGATRLRLGPGDAILWPTAVRHRVAGSQVAMEAHAPGAGDGGQSSHRGPRVDVHVLKLGQAPLPAFVGFDRPHVLTARDRDRSTGSIAEALRTELSHGGANPEVVGALVRALWLRSLDGKVDLRGADRGLAAMVRVVMDDPEGVRDVGELSRRCGLSRSRFHERFVASHGEPPGQWLLRVRMRHARHLLQDGRLSVAAVADRLGYASESAFRKAYRRVLGVAARAVR